MGGVADMVTGKSAKKQRVLAAVAQAEQQKRLDEDKARVDAIETGQRVNARRGGGGLLAFVDDTLRSTMG